MSDRGDFLRLADMHDQIGFIELAIRDKSEADFLSDRELYQAVAFSLQVIGEAANNLSPETRSKAADVPWPKVIALRNRIAHGYFALELTEIWRIAVNDAPALKSSLTAAGLAPPADIG